MTTTNLTDIRRALDIAQNAANVLEGPASRGAHEGALAAYRSALLSIMDAAQDELVATPEGVPE
jgi:hypothetical protein